MKHSAASTFLLADTAATVSKCSSSNVWPKSVYAIKELDSMTRLPVALSDRTVAEEEGPPLKPRMIPSPLLVLS